MKVIINGAGIAGPALAYWLRRGGHDVVLVEAAPKLRTGGYVVDFWGVGYDIADKMGNGSTWKQRLTQRRKDAKKISTPLERVDCDNSPWRLCALA